MSEHRPLEATGERLVPELQWGELVHAEHLVRYRLVRPLVAGKRVLDAATGEGYGAALLRDAGAKRVVGIDVSPDAVAHARTAHGIEAEQADIVDLPFEDGSFDVVVSFETIEHVAEPERALDELKRVLDPEGVLVISTPNARKYLADNEFHLREFTSEEFVAVLGERFQHVVVRYQDAYLASAVLSEAEQLAADGATPVEAEVVKLVSGKPGEELYTVALCGDRPPPDVPSTALLANVHEAHDLLKQKFDADAAAQEWRARAHKAEEEIEPWRERAAEAERLVGEWNARATEAERQNAELRRQLDVITSSKSWRITAPLRRLGERGRGGGDTGAGSG
jgi:2-polyprenyl-3-methyl-5-hydroxy-6-metoxy-1,4-benzoquinol methylase